MVEEAVDLGAVVGTLRMRQLAPRSFNDACKSTAQGDATDCTGQRVYAGCARGADGRAASTLSSPTASPPRLVRSRATME